MTDSTQVKDLESLFINDSIAKYNSDNKITGNDNDFELYEKGGRLLLVLTPSAALDSTSTFKLVRVVDDRFKTAKGITSRSTFKELKDAYEISGIQNTSKSLIVSFKSVNVYVTIDMSELPAELGYDPEIKIEAIQIPDNAIINDLYIQWY